MIYRGCTYFPIPNSHLKDLFRWRFTRKKFQAHNTKMLGATTQYLVATAKWRQ